MEFWHAIAFWMSVSLKFFSLASLAQQFSKINFSFLNSNPKTSSLHYKTRFFMLIQLIQHISIFVFYIALYDKGKVGCHTLNYHGNLTINYGIVMEKSWNFILYFLWEPWNMVVLLDLLSVSYIVYVLNTVSIPMMGTGRCCFQSFCVDAFIWHVTHWNLGCLTICGDSVCCKH